MAMDVKAAVDVAKNQINMLFGDEQIKNLGLEEVVLDETQPVWRVTLGFSRPWDEPRHGSLAAITGQAPAYSRRVYKVVTIDADTGTMVSIKSLEEKV